MGNSCGKQESGQEGLQQQLQQRQKTGGRLGSLATAQAAPASWAAVVKAAARTGGRGSTVTTARALMSGFGSGAAAGTQHGPVAVSPPPPRPKRSSSGAAPAAPATPPPPAASSHGGGAGGQPQQQQRQRASTASDDAGAAAGADPSAAPAAAAASANLAPAAAAVGGLVVSKLRSDCAVRDAYKLGRTLGKGGFAVVRLATDRATGVDWAVKVMALPRQGQTPGDNDNTIEDILKEIDILCGLSHPNVVCLREYFAERGRVYLVTELVTGGELLGAVLSSGTCGERDARVAFSQLLKGIQYLHSRGVVHRDLKLENLLLSTAGELHGLKIADFGLARRVGGGGAFGAGAMSTVCGTPQYVAPEVIAGVPGLEYGPKVDAWSAGVVLFVLLGGYPPFWAESEPVLFGLVRRGHFTFDDPAWASVSESAKDLIRRLLVVDPAKRLSASEALQHPWILEGTDECELPVDGGGELFAAAMAGGGAAA